jgi:hypothetical protein
MIRVWMTDGVQLVMMTHTRDTASTTTSPTTPSMLSNPNARQMVSRVTTAHHPVTLTSAVTPTNQPVTQPLNPYHHTPLM